MAKATTAATMPELKQKIRELKKSIVEATSAKRADELKKLRRRKRRLKARTRALARTAKATAAAAAAPPAA